MPYHRAATCSNLPCRDDDGTPVTARRFLAVAKSGGDDDYFSFSFSHDARQVGGLSVILVAHVCTKLVLCLARQQAQ